MKQIIYVLGLIAVFFTTNQLFAQQDKSYKALQNETSDSARVRILCDLSFDFLNTNVDSAMYFAQEALRIAQNGNYDDGCSRSLNAIGNILLQTGQNDKALETYLAALKKAESAESDSRIAQTFSNIGNFYINQGEYRLPLDYLFKAKTINEKNNDQSKLIINLVNIGICYQYLDIPDSALHYLEQALAQTEKLKTHENESAILLYMGSVYEDKNNIELAKSYYRQSIEKSTLYINHTIISSALQAMGRILKTIDIDSSLMFTSQAYEYASNNKNYMISLNSASTLYQLYLNKNEKDSSLKYLKIKADLKDSMFNYEKSKYIQTLTFQEKLRQDEMVKNAELEQKQRMQNIQYIGIAAFILSLFVCLILLSRKKVHPRIIETVGLVSLLLFFEFIALFLHPYIEAWSHHKPVIALLILVCIASILVPTHHRLEKWIKEKLVKK